MRKIVVIVLAGGVIGVASWFIASPHFRVGVLNTLGLQTNAPVEPDLAPVRFVGRQACAACHRREDHLWQGSHHDLAMQEANEQTVLGDFNHAQVTQFGVTSTFYRQDGRYMVRTDGPDGALQDYAITFTFGVTPLQQYLIEFTGGWHAERLQPMPRRPDRGMGFCPSQTVVWEKSYRVSTLCRSSAGRSHGSARNRSPTDPACGRRHAARHRPCHGAVLVAHPSQSSIDGCGARWPAGP